MSDVLDPWLPFPDDNGVIPSDRPAILIQVYRINVTPGDGETDAQDVEPTGLPNVVCLAIEERIGDTPSTAVFRYVFDRRDDLAPQNTEQALSTDYTRGQFPDLVETGDRLGVLATTPDGDVYWLFDGFCLSWAMRIDGDTDSVVMTAVGVAKTCWNTPIPGAVFRASETPETPGNDVTTDLIAQFNPRGVANASPSTGDSGEDPYKYPVQMDPGVKGTDTAGKDYPRVFDLPMGCANLIYLNNPDQTWVTNPKRTDLDDMLVSREPRDGVPFDPNDDSTYDAKPIACPDTPLTDRPWPSAVYEFVRHYGFSVRWPLTTDLHGNPSTAFEIFLKQGGEPKPLLLQERGAEPFDPAQTNVGSADLGRDLSGVVNRWVVAGALDRYEADFVLAPIFPMTTTDADEANLAAYNKNDLDADTTDAYRTFVLDEDGTLHYANGSSDPVNGEATLLDSLFGPPSPVPGDPEGDPVPTYVSRRRPPIGNLFTVDSNGKPMRALLWISTDYAGEIPGLWDGTGTWRQVNGGFELLKDRIGIRITAPNPNAWNVGKSASGPFQGQQVVKVVECLANPSAENPAFFLRLTCVVEADQGLKAVAELATSSPLTVPITRTVDARDRYAKQTLYYPSANNASGPDNLVVRDDTDSATAEAEASRTATESGAMEGTVTIPRFTAFYGIGDRISEIQGRELGLRTDSAGAGYAPVLPIVIGRRWELDGGQHTILLLSDEGLDRRRYGLKRGGNGSVSRHGTAPPQRPGGSSGGL